MSDPQKTKLKNRSANFLTVRRRVVPQRTITLTAATEDSLANRAIIPYKAYRLRAMMLTIISGTTNGGTLDIQTIKIGGTTKDTNDITFTPISMPGTGAIASYYVHKDAGKGWYAVIGSTARTASDTNQLTFATDEYFSTDNSDSRVAASQRGVVPCIVMSTTMGSATIHWFVVVDQLDEDM